MEHYQVYPRTITTNSKPFGFKISAERSSPFKRTFGKNPLFFKSSCIEQKNWFNQLRPDGFNCSGRKCHA